MKTSIRINKRHISDDTYSRNEASIIKETAKTVTFGIATEPHQSRLTETQIKKNWSNWIY